MWIDCYVICKNKDAIKCNFFFNLERYVKQSGFFAPNFRILYFVKLSDSFNYFFFYKSLHLMHAIEAHPSVACSSKKKKIVGRKSSVENMNSI
jgi:hypothetical protein